VLNAAIKAGYIEILNDANAIVTSANCGACPGLHAGVLAPGDVAITSITPNFEGRMGPKAEIYLASPRPWPRRRWKGVSRARSNIWRRE
jgi:3-isopropylmalate/(R)-2-methylmalate dehydratase large subunit